MLQQRKILLIITVLLFSSAFSLSGKNSERIRPKWVTHTLPESKSGTYTFIRAHGEGSSLVEAKKMAFISMSQKLENERRLTVNTSVKIRERLYQSISGTDDTIEQEIVLDVTEDGHQLKIVCREIDDYWVETKGNYSADVLYVITDKHNLGGSYLDEIIVSSKYGATGLLSIVPSLGQFYKGDSFKGFMVISGEALALFGVILCDNTRASYIKKMKEQPKYAAEYNSRADLWETGRNICIGAATSVYLYNLIDAFVAVGAKHIIVKSKRMAFSTEPIISEQYVGVGIALKF
jgi:hypothetical protein